MLFNVRHLFSNPKAHKIFKATAVYTGSNLFNKIVPFILLPVLTRLLTPEDYGIVATFTAIFAIVQIIIYMGTTDAIVRGYYDKGKHSFNFPEYVFNGIFINFIVFLLILVLWCIFRPYFMRIIPIPFGYQLLIPVLGFFVTVYGIPTKLWIIMKKPLPYAVFDSANTITELGLSLFLVAVAGLSWRGRVWGIFLSGALFFLIGLYVLYKNNFFRALLHKNYLQDIIKYGSHVVLHSLGFPVIGAIDMFFINKFVGLSSTGVYSVSYSISSIILFLSSAFSAAWVPIFYETLNRITPTLKIRLVQVTYLYFIALIAGMLVFVNVIPLVLHIIVGEKFIGAKVFVFWLSLGFVFHNMYTMVVGFIFYEKRTSLLSKVAVFTVVLSILFNYILIKLNGAVGIAQATCLVFLSRFLLVWYFSNRIYPMPWFSFTKKLRVAIND